MYLLRATTAAALLGAAALLNSASAMTEAEKELLIGDAPVATLAAESLLLLGDPTNFVSPAVPLPAGRTPHDGNNTNDGGWLLVDFCLEGATGSGPAQATDCHHNDDDSSSLALPFNFTLYGTTFTKAFINNNGNLSFGQLFSTFTASGFPVSNFPMVAPFWGDVDTGDQNDDGGNHNTLGHVWYQFIGTDTLALTWDNVGYFNEHADKLSTFQVLISDGTNASMGIGNNVCFAYDDMQWTTGDASSGSGGFGGVPATVGANAGNGVDFFQLGRFDKAGTSYDGPGGANDGVDFLDGKGAGSGNAICLNASGQNVPPIPIDFPTGNIATGQCNETLNFTVSFLSPEAGQVTTVVVTDPDDAQGGGLAITNNSGNTANINFNWAAGPEDVGTYNITLDATDNGVPSSGSTTEVLEINIECPFIEAVIDIKPGSDPNAINRRSGGVIPVAILGSDIFDVNTVNVSTLLFGVCGDEVAPVAHDNLDGHYEDVNSDGFTDLVTHYKARATNFLNNSTQGCLAGELLDGQFFVGNDSVKIVK